MLNLTGREQTIVCPVEKVFAFASDFRNFSDLMPAQVYDYTAAKDSCKFNIAGLGTVSMLMQEQYAPVLIRAISTKDTPVNFELQVNLKNLDGLSTSASVFVSADIGAMLALLVRDPLQQIADQLVQKLKEACEGI